MALGASPGKTPGLKSDFQAFQLKSLLARQLGERVELRLFANQADLLRQIETDKIDFAIISPDFFTIHSEQLVLVGSLDKDENLIVVAGPRDKGELSQRMAMALANLVSSGEEGSFNLTAISVSNQESKPATAEKLPGMEPTHPASPEEIASGIRLQAFQEKGEARATVAPEPPPDPPPEEHPASSKGLEAMPIEPQVTRESEEMAASSSLIPESIAQPDIPLNLRPPKIPDSRSARTLQTDPPLKAQQPLTLPAEGTPMLLLSRGGTPVLVLSSENAWKTPLDATLPPETDPEPNVIYVIPFITIMVPDEVRERIFDQFVDKLNKLGADIKMTFRIFKGKVEEEGEKFLAIRRHVNGEIYGYVEESGCCSTNISTNIKLTYFEPGNTKHFFEYEYNSFFNHDNSSLSIERIKLADAIVYIITSEIMRVIGNKRP